MRASLLLRTGVVGLLAALAMASPGWADTTISINSGNVPTSAAGFDGHSCDPNQGGGPLPGQDVWVFVLPGNHTTSGDFVSVTADFGAHGTVTITSAANPGDFDNGGPQTAKAWITTPAGWTLTGATAVITKTADFFNLTHTCPAAPASPSPSPSSPAPSSPAPSSPAPSSPAPSTPAPSTPAPSTPAPSTPAPSTPAPSSPVPSSPVPSSSISASTSTAPATSPAPSQSTGAIPSGGVKAGGGGDTPAGSLLWGLVALTLAAGGAVMLVLVRRRRDNA